MGTITILTSTYNIYGTEAEAIIYFAADIDGGSYVNAETITQQQSLVSATRWADSLGLYVDGVKISPNPTDEGIPEQLRQGVYELAIELIENPQAAESLGSNVKIADADGTKVEFFRPTLVANTPLPTKSQRLLEPYLGSTNDKTLMETFGSEYTPLPTFDLNDGFA